MPEEQNLTFQQLQHKAKIIRASADLRKLKSNTTMPTTTTTPKFLTNQQAQQRIAALEKENAGLKVAVASARAAAPAAKASVPLAKATTAPAATPPTATAPATTVNTWQKPVAPTMAKAEFDSMNSAQKMSFCKAGGKITN